MTAETERDPEWQKRRAERIAEAMAETPLKSIEECVAEWRNENPLTATRVLERQRAQRLRAPLAGAAEVAWLAERCVYFEARLREVLAENKQLRAELETLRK